MVSLQIDEENSDDTFAYLEESSVPLTSIKDTAEPQRFRSRSSSPNGYLGSIKRFVKKPFILLLALSLILLFIVITAASSSSPSLPPNPDSNQPALKTPKPIIDDQRKRYDFESPLRSELSANPPASVKWTVSGLDGSYISQTSSEILVKHIEFKTQSTIALNADIRDSKGDQILFSNSWVSPDLGYVMISNSKEKGWRHSFFADYFIYNPAVKKTSSLTMSVSDKIIPGELGSGKVSLATWAPEGNSIVCHEINQKAWVRDNDLYVSTVLTDTEDSFLMKETRITFDGSKETINGISDWVYEEEVLESHDALWFSPDGNRLAYLKFNESLVPEYKLQLYETPHLSYPREVSVKYPKPGFPNPIVTLHVATPASNQSIHDVAVIFKDIDAFADSDRLIVEVKWLTRNDTILVRLMNRVQDHQRVFLVQPAIVMDALTNSSFEQWEATLVRDETNKDNAWFNILKPVSIVESRKDRKNPSYLELKEDAAGFTHIAYFGDISSRDPTAWLTRGSWEVTLIVSVNADSGMVYYLSTEVDSTQRHLYSVHLNGFDVSKLTPPANIGLKTAVPYLNWTIPAVAVTNNDLVPPAKEKRKEEKYSVDIGGDGFYTASFSPKCTYYILNYRGPDIPFSKVIKVEDNGLVRDLDDNAGTRQVISTFNLPQHKFFTIPNDNGDSMNAKMVVPPGFQDDGSIEYPVLMRVYGGPNSQTVQQIYGYDYMSSIANSGFVVLFVDGRGTGFKGRAYRACVSRDLGNLEVVDQIAAAKFMSKLPFVDAKRIAIWGWSYGGYMAAKTIEANSGVFAVGMAVAPVTDWRYYDSVYTERYMKTPQTNEDGYTKAAVQNMQGFKSKPFLVVHGTSDDNVHFQNTADLVWHFTQAGIQNYQVQIYTDSDHNIDAGGANTQVYQLLRDFLFRNLNHTVI